MMPLQLSLIAALLCFLSGIPALLSVVSVKQGRKLAFYLISMATVCGLCAVILHLFVTGQFEMIETIWKSPFGSLQFRLDSLSAFFMIPVLLVGFSISLYNCGYTSPSANNRAESLLIFYFGIIISSIIMLLLAASGATMLIFWEVMALSVFFAMCMEHGRQEVIEAGLQYLVASHVTVLVLIMMYSLLGQNGVTVFPAPGAMDASSASATAVMLLALAGFGLKAGIMPLHVWLPAAHANAPSTVSAFMSGIILKMGIYGLLRTLSFFGTPPLWWGVLLLVLGVISAVAGVLFAIGQHDLKRLLAYHSIENIGIIVMGIGIALIGLSCENRILFVLGMAGALLHVLNHALFKSLLFLAAGAVIHTVGTRDMDRMGGLSRALPLTSVAFLAGAVAICGLPPLNGFVSELLIYLGIFNGFGLASGNVASVMALAAVALALTGGLAVACFVKVFGSVFLGSARTILPAPHENRSMSVAMAVLAALCTLIGVLPFFVVRLLEPVVQSLFPQQGVLLPSIQTTAGVYGISVMAALLILTVVVLFVYYINRLKSTPVSSSVTWDCGYAAPTSSMQYTASSFAEMLVRIFSGILRPEYKTPSLTGLFPEQGSFHSHVPEVTLDRGIIPFMLAVDRRLSSVRRLQSGQLNRYLMYIFVALIILLTISHYS
jgi:hydrogenase-4 component B